MKPLTRNLQNYRQACDSAIDGDVKKRSRVERREGLVKELIGTAMSGLPNGSLDQSVVILGRA